MKKGEFCEDYCGVACIDGTCPVANYEMWPEYFDERPTCAKCWYVKGCEDCYFADENNECRLEEMLNGKTEESTST